MDCSLPRLVVHLSCWCQRRFCLSIYRDDRMIQEGFMIYRHVYCVTVPFSVQRTTHSSIQECLTILISAIRLIRKLTKRGCARLLSDAPRRPTCVKRSDFGS